MRYILFLLSFFSISFANAQIGNVVLFSQEGESFYVILNGIRQNDKAQTNVKVTDLTAPVYKLKVIFTDVNLGEVDQNLYLEQGSEVTYNIRKNNKGNYVLRLMSSVPLAEAPRDPLPQQWIAVYTATPRTEVVQQTTQTTTTQQGGNAGVNINIGGVGFDMNIHDPLLGGSQTTTTHTTTTTTTTTNNNPYQAPPRPNPYYQQETVYEQPAPPPIVYVAGYTGPIGCPIPANNADFNKAKESIASKSFDQTMFETAKTITKNKCFTTAQVSEIVEVFSFEETKLNYAKFAYDYTYDKGNFYQVADKFSFSTDQEKLLRYIDGR